MVIDLSVHVETKEKKRMQIIGLFQQQVELITLQTFSFGLQRLSKQLTLIPVRVLKMGVGYKCNCISF